MTTNISLYRLLISHLTLFFFLLFLFSPVLVQAQEAAPAGRVIASSGEIKAKNSKGVTRKLQQNSPVYGGDTLITGSNSAQIRFSDGSLTSLRPGT